MKMKSISGLLFFVKDLDKTAEFYEKLGFEFKDKTPAYMKAYLNWFWIEFIPTEKAEENVFKKIVDPNISGSNLFVEISVENTDESYDDLVKKGFKPENKPQDFPWGRREFVLRDPNGYKLVFFEKK